MTPAFIRFIDNRVSRPTPTDPNGGPLSVLTLLGNPYSSKASLNTAQTSSAVFFSR